MLPQVYSDLSGNQINGTTIPAHILVTNGSKPDQDLVNRKEKMVAIIELTCPLEANIKEAHRRKSLKYTQLQIHLEDKGFTVFTMAQS